MDKERMEVLKRDIDHGVKATMELGKWFNEQAPENAASQWRVGSIYFGGVCKRCEGVVMFAVVNGPASMRCNCTDREWEFDGAGLVRWIPR